MIPQEQTRPQYITVAEAAEYLKCSPRTVRAFIADGRIPAYRIGPRLIRIDPHDLDAITSRIPTYETR